MNHSEADLPAAGQAVPRRSYLGWLVGLCAAGVGATLALPLVRFTLFPLRVKTTEVKWSDVGAATEFASLSAPLQRDITVEQVDGWRKTISKKVVYVTKNPAGTLEILSSVCPHLGCTVPWSDANRKFICPCHGASFSADGARLGGPAPRGMDSLDSEIQDGRLMVRYQYFRQLVPTKEVIG